MNYQQTRILWVLVKIIFVNGLVMPVSISADRTARHARIDWQQTPIIILVVIGLVFMVFICPVTLVSNA